MKYPEEFAGIEDTAGNLPVGMVNLIAGRRIVPELLQRQFTAANVATELGRLLVDGPEREAQIADLAEVRRKLSGVGPAELARTISPIERVATAILTLLNGSNRSVSPKP